MATENDLEREFMERHHTDGAAALPLISLIVPVYNVREYLEKCLQSVCGQTYQNLEILLIDDGSTDGSGELCDTYARSDARIRVVHQANGGLSAARNTGLAMARGDYFGFVDSDDWIDPDMYECLYRLLAEHMADISICSHYVEKPSKTRCRHASGRLTVFSRDEAVRTLVKDRRIKNYMWNKLFRRSLFEDITFPVNKIYEDIATSYRLFCKARSVVVQDTPKYHYRRRNGSLTHGRLYDYRREYRFFRTVYEQVKFVREAKIWHEAPCSLHRRGIQMIEHLLMLPSSAETDAVIGEVLAAMHEFDDITWRQLGLFKAWKRYMLYHHLGLYRPFCRWVGRALRPGRYDVRPAEPRP